MSRIPKRRILQNEKQNYTFSPIEYIIRGWFLFLLFSNSHVPTGPRKRGSVKMKRL